jgi:hypothetical protein
MVTGAKHPNKAFIDVTGVQITRRLEIDKRITNKAP